MGLFKGKDITTTQATDGSGVEARQARARRAMRGNDGRGGLLGRMAGAKSGGAISGNNGSQNAGSMRFQEMIGEQTQAAFSGEPKGAEGW